VTAENPDATDDDEWVEVVLSLAALRSEVDYTPGSF
jgi:hypothetical protein